MHRAFALFALLFAASTLADAEGELAAAIRLYEDFQPEQALPKLRALALSSPSVGPRARAHLYLGLCLATLGDSGSASAAFVDAFLIEPELKVPPETLAEIVRRAETARSEAKATLAARAREAAEAKARAAVEARVQAE
ncbi:MAG: hypothetical protein ACOZIN_18360, partial [Myxococcota bacterium]